jgi:hypothetical protein
MKHDTTRALREPAPVIYNHILLRADPPPPLCRQVIVWQQGGHKLGVLDVASKGSTVWELPPSIAIATVKNAGPDAWVLRDNREVRKRHLSLVCVCAGGGSEIGQELSRRTRAAMTSLPCPSGLGTEGSL